MKNLILEKIWDRIEQEKNDSELAYFISLMYLGEVITKFSCLFMLSGLNDSQNNYKYNQNYKLVRANGIGDWSSCLDEVLTGPSSQELKIDYNRFSKELTEKTNINQWQNKAVVHLLNCLKALDYNPDVRVNRLQLKTWFGYFAYLRNKTRGHGAITIDTAETINQDLAPSLKLICKNFSPFSLQWCYLSQNLSGKYKVLSISKNVDNFAYLTTSLGIKSSLETGVYTYINQPIKIDLIYTDDQLSEFFFPNGSFGKNGFEVLSYSTGVKQIKEAEPFLKPPGTLPDSETKGFEELRIVNKCFTNIPDYQSTYINRPNLEKSLIEIVTNQRHPIITLIGRGGIGKTTLTLKVLKDLCNIERFDNIFWFSSRDIDLMELGAKTVKPEILNIEDAVNVFNKLIGPNKPIKDKEKLLLFQNSLSDQNNTSLFVFDNFETVNDQFSMFSWLDTYIRLPNKILITSRMNEFKADYPISVGGMEYAEFTSLIENISNKLNITELINQKYIDQLYEESSGHPYVAKILLGQVANDRKVGDIKRIVADQDNVLQALFERTYKQLSAASKRVFLTIGSWRSTIPKIAVEAVLKTTIEDNIDVENAIDELFKFSLIDKIETVNNDVLLSLPVSAQLFAEKKVKTDIYHFAIKKDVTILMKFGVGRNTEIENGIEKRISKFFKEIAKEISQDQVQIDTYIPIIEYLSIKRPETYLLYSTLMEEFNFTDEAIEACNKYISNTEESKTINAWKRLIKLYKGSANYVAEINSIINLCNIEQSSAVEISNLLKRYCHLLRLRVLRDENERKLLSSTIIDLVKEEENYNILNLDDKSNLAWIYLHNNQKEYASREATNVIREQPNHSEALKILNKLNINFPKDI